MSKLKEFNQVALSVFVICLLGGFILTKFTDSPNDRASDNDGVCQFRDPTRLSCVRNAESDCNRQIRGSADHRNIFANRM